MWAKAGDAVKREPTVLAGQPKVRCEGKTGIEGNSQIWGLSNCAKWGAIR